MTLPLRTVLIIENWEPNLTNKIYVTLPYGYEIRGYSDYDQNVVMVRYCNESQSSEELSVDILKNNDLKNVESVLNVGALTSSVGIMRDYLKTLSTRHADEFVSMMNMIVPKLDGIDLVSRNTTDGGNFTQFIEKIGNELSSMNDKIDEIRSEKDEMRMMMQDQRQMISDLRDEILRYREQSEQKHDVYLEQNRMMIDYIGKTNKMFENFGKIRKMVRFAEHGTSDSKTLIARMSEIIDSDDDSGKDSPPFFDSNIDDADIDKGVSIVEINDDDSDNHNVDDRTQHHTSPDDFISQDRFSWSDEVENEILSRSNSYDKSENEKHQDEKVSANLDFNTAVSESSYGIGSNGMDDSAQAKTTSKSYAKVAKDNSDFKLITKSRSSKRQIDNSMTPEIIQNAHEYRVGEDEWTVPYLVTNMNNLISDIKLFSGINQRNPNQLCGYLWKNVSKDFICNDLKFQYYQPNWPDRFGPNYPHGMQEPHPHEVNVGKYVTKVVVSIKGVKEQDKYSIVGSFDVMMSCFGKVDDGVNVFVRGHAKILNSCFPSLVDSKGIVTVIIGRNESKNHFGGNRFDELRTRSNLIPLEDPFVINDEIAGTFLGCTKTIENAVTSFSKNRSFLNCFNSYQVLSKYTLVDELIEYWKISESNDRDFCRMHRLPYRRSDSPLLHGISGFNGPPELLNRLTKALELIGVAVSELNSISSSVKPSIDIERYFKSRYYAKIDSEVMDDCLDMIRLHERGINGWSKYDANRVSLVCGYIKLNKPSGYRPSMLIDGSQTSYMCPHCGVGYSSRIEEMICDMIDTMTMLSHKVIGNDMKTEFEALINGRFNANGKSPANRKFVESIRVVQPIKYTKLLPFENGNVIVVLSESRKNVKCRVDECQNVTLAQNIAFFKGGWRP